VLLRNTLTHQFADDNHSRGYADAVYRTPRHIYQEGLWICGRSALPTGCASPACRASSESQEMLAFAHIPTGTTTNNEFANDEVNGKNSRRIHCDRSRHQSRQGSP
jgi:hypothetical protein